MGMFDYIRCQMPLPAEPAPPKIEWFQTKDTEDISGQLYLEKWTITADGRLIHHNCDYKWEPNEAETGIMKFAGALKSVNKRDEEKKFHGDICFYEYDSVTEEWWEYVARFTDGICTKIWCSEHRPAATPPLTPPVKE